MTKKANGVVKGQIHSLIKAADILELFLKEKKPLGLADFAERLEMPKTTILGFVKTLVAIHFLEKDPITQKYRLGPKMLQLGLRYITNTDVITLAKIWMERLCHKFNETVNTGILVGDSVVVIFNASPENEFMTVPRAGTAIPAHTSCIGKMLYAHLSPKRLERILETYEFIRLTENTITDRDAFLRELEEVRREKVSFDREENFKGLAGIGGPVYNYTGNLIAAFAITGKADTIYRKREQIIEEVRSSSVEISRQLGYLPGE
ncbi:MAG: IclR family transcriptional regulator [Spirochaetes bacterium]|nr:MAG: IclR family transcriptional regulator [Spirochaetota bacterium]